MSCSPCQGTERGLSNNYASSGSNTNFTGRQSGERNQQKSARHREGLRERQKPKRKRERIGKWSSKMERRSAGEKERRGGRTRASEYERLRDTMLENSLWSLSRGTRGDGIPRRTLLKFIQPFAKALGYYTRDAPAQLSFLCLLSVACNAAHRRARSGQTDAYTPIGHT